MEFSFFSLFIGLVFGSLSITLWLKNSHQKKLASLYQELQQKNLELVKITAQNESQVASSKQMAMEFENLAQKIFEEKSIKFTDQNLKNIGGLLEPLKERLKDFQKKVEDTYSAEQVERVHLKGELQRLLEMNQKLSQDATNLTRALKGDVKQQGNWGEMILESILERSGLRAGEEYILQGTDMQLRSSDGGILRPDVIVKLPEDKHIIVDAKMTLSAYEAYANAEEPSEQERHAKLHLEALKKHIDGLSEKKYHMTEGLTSPDFVILFMPLEPAFALAFKLKPELFQEAWDKNIAIVSPTTLLVTLKTVTALWRQARQEKNALEIARRGGALYDKFVGLVRDFDDVGTKIEAAQKAHSAVMRKIDSGPGNLIRQAEMLRDLGAKTEKRLEIKESLNDDSPAEI